MTAAPDYVEPVLAWRTWLAVREGRRVTLRSVVFPTRWSPARPAVAACLRTPSFFERVRKKTRAHLAPASECACGIYGAALPTASSYLGTPVNGAHVVGRVVGIVSLWGNVVECAAGWRASRGYPRHLFVPLGPLREPLAEGLTAYGVPVDLVDASGAHDVWAALASFERHL